MGEIAEMMLEGILCEGCGEFIGSGAGAPRRCAGCGSAVDAPWGVDVGGSRRSPGARRTQRDNAARAAAAAVRKPFRCDRCGKRFTARSGLGQHHRDKHSGDDVAVL